MDDKRRPAVEDVKQRGEDLVREVEGLMGGELTKHDRALVAAVVHVLHAHFARVTPEG